MEMQSSAAWYPARLTFDPPEKIANWRPLVHWLLAIPHVAVMYALAVAAQVCAVISWFAIVFTGRMPAGLANMEVLYLRYGARTMTYVAFLRGEYPPFTFDMTPNDPGDDPRVRVDIRPQLENRNRLTTAFRIILAIPHFIALAFVMIAVDVVVLIAFFAVLFTGRWPSGMRNFVLGFGRWYIRALAYALLLTDDYPPFSMD